MPYLRKLEVTQPAATWDLFPHWSNYLSMGNSISKSLDQLNCGSAILTLILTLALTLTGQPVSVNSVRPVV
jgi:hypothetical protein